MKKFFFMAMMAATATAMAQNSNAAITAAQDSLSENFGTVYGASVASTYAGKPLTDKDEFVKGFQAVMGVDTARHAYADGMNLALDVIKMTQDIASKRKVNINRDKFAKAFLANFTATTPLAPEQMQQLNEKLAADMGRVSHMAITSDPEYIAMGKAGEEYAKKALAQPGFKQTPSGLIYKMEREGNGDNFAEHDRVRLNYKGMHTDGSTFDQSRDTTTMGVSQVVPGFKEALMLMKPGSKLTAVIPAKLGYGDRGAGGVIKPNETLVFEIETYSAEKPAAPRATVHKGAEKGLNPGVKTVAPKRKK